MAVWWRCPCFVCFFSGVVDGCGLVFFWCCWRWWCSCLVLFFSGVVVGGGGVLVLFLFFLVLLVMVVFMFCFCFSSFVVVMFLFLFFSLVGNVLFLLLSLFSLVDFGVGGVFFLLFRA